MTSEPVSPIRQGSVDYYRGVADAMDVIRAYDFPFTERVDVIADALAPTREEAGEDNA